LYALPHLQPILSLLCNRQFFRWNWVSWYQNVSILDFIGAKDDRGGGDNWNYKMREAPVKSSPPTNQHPVFLQARCPSCHPTNSVKSAEENITFIYQKTFFISAASLLNSENYAQKRPISHHSA